MMNYEESVRWLRAQPEQQQGIRDSYLDADNEVSARRFAEGEEFAQVARWLRLHGAPRAILDVGCGNGIASYAMGMLGHRVTALDPDASADVGLEAARRLVPLVEAAGGALRCELGYVEQLPFEDASFDVVYTRQAVHHFADLEAGLRECHRVLKPGGVFLASREHVVNDEAQLQQFLREHALHHLHGGENAYRLDEYVNALRAAGFAHTRVFGIYDAVVNHFPRTNADVDAYIERSCRAKFKTPLAAHLLRLPGFSRLWRAQMSRVNDDAGRLYSFLCRA